MGKVVCLIGSLLASSVSGATNKDIMNLIKEGRFDQAFGAFDEDGSGALDKEIEKLAEFWGTSGGHMMKKADTNQDGKIDMEEFLKYTIMNLIKQGRLENAFRAFDEDGSGALDKEIEKLAEFWGNKVGDMMEAADTNQDRKIDMEEFLTYKVAEARFHRIDEDNDGVVSEKEANKQVLGSLQMKPLPMKTFEELSKVADVRKSDRLIDPAEFSAFLRMRSHFKTLDKNKDGKIEKCEASEDVVKGLGGNSGKFEELLDMVKDDGNGDEFVDPRELVLLFVKNFDFE